MVGTWLLVTDVDDTLLGDDAALRRLVGALAGTTVAVVLNSSRPIDSVAAGWRSVTVALPLAGIIGALGTEIELAGNRLDSWSSQFADFDRHVISATLAGFGPPHRPEFQTAAKVSHAVPSEHWTEAMSALQHLGVPLRFVTSGASNFDAVPGAAGKAAALRYVAACLAVPPERVIAAGDSENDADMLRAANGIAVGNATDGLRRLLDGGTYLAAGFHADGIVEGLRHYGVRLADHTSSPMR